MEHGIYAYVDLCIGPGDEQKITGIKYQKTGKDYVFASPLIKILNQKGELEAVPVFSGQIFTELSALCATYMDQIKKLGRFGYSKTYRVTVSNAKDVTDGE